MTSGVGGWSPDSPASRRESHARTRSGRSSAPAPALSAGIQAATAHDEWFWETVARQSQVSPDFINLRTVTTSSPLSEAAPRRSRP